MVAPSTDMSPSLRMWYCDGVCVAVTWEDIERGRKRGKYPCCPAGREALLLNLLLNRPSTRWAAPCHDQPAEEPGDDGGGCSVATGRTVALAVYRVAVS